MTTVVGLDPSLTAAGIAAIAHPRQSDTPNVPKLATIGVGGAASASDSVTGLRIWAQRDAILRSIPPSPALIVVEALPRPNPNAPGKHSERCGLYWALVAYLARKGIPIAVCSPTTLKKFATGNGRAEKPAMLAAARELWPHASVRDHNASDALLLATAGAYRLGWYEPELPHHIDPNITWPKEIR